MSEASEVAKSKGLEYGGFARWVDPQTREEKGRTVKGKFVPSSSTPEIEDDEDDLGKVTILDLDRHVLNASSNSPKVVAKYIEMLKTILRTAGKFYLLIPRNSQKAVAKFLLSKGISQGPKLVPLGGADVKLKQKFVEQKVRGGYSDIQYFDTDPEAITAVNALKGPYSNLDVRIDAHKIPAFTDLTNKKAA